MTVDIRLYLTLFLKVNDIVYNVNILVTFSCIWEDVFSTSHDVGRLTDTVDMTDFDLSHSLSPFCYSPSGLLHKSTHFHPEKAEHRSHEIKKGKKGDGERTKKEEEVEKQVKPMAIMRNV